MSSFPDNAKVAVIKACLYEPQVNRTYAEMAAHYGTAVLATRPRRPRDKAKVGAKWLELLKQLAPRATRVAILYDPANAATAGYLHEIEAAAPDFAVQLSPLAVRDASDIARGLDGFAVEPNGSLILLPGPVGANNRDLIIALAARHRLPAIYAFRYHVVSGGLASYGIDNIDLYRRAAWYVDRIFKGEKPAELPVQHATKFQLVINLKTAKALGLDPPMSLLARTDEVIE